MPVLLSVEPPTITNDVKQRITLNGLNCRRVPTATVGSSSLAITFVNTRTLRATVPAGFPVGVYTVTVTNPNGQQGWLEDALTVVVQRVYLPLILRAFELSLGETCESD